MSNLRADKIILFIATLFLSFNIMSLNAFADEDEFDDMTFAKIISKLYNYPKEVKNKNFIEFGWGAGRPWFDKALVNETFANLYPVSVSYGFQRMNKFLKTENRHYTGSEYVEVENLSSHLKPKSWKKDGNTVDIWRFTAGYTNGWGYVADLSYSFNHTSYLGWVHSDIELPSLIQAHQKTFDIYDRKYRFSTGFKASITADLYETIFARVSFNRSIIYPGFNFFQWFVGSVAELCLQRIIDAYGEQYLAQNPNIFPIANFILKNTISFMHYQLKKENMQWPFASDKPWNVYHFSISFAYLF